MTTPSTEINLHDWRTRNRDRRAAVRLIHGAWVKATDENVSEQLYRVMDYLMTPEGLVQHSATARWHRENSEAER